MRKGTKAKSGVRRFFKQAHAANIYLSAQTMGEIRRGLENIRHCGDLPQSRKLEKWLEVIVGDYADKILSFDEDCAHVWGRLLSPHPQHSIDKLIAAIALIHNLTVVTRNVDDFRGTGVEVNNPVD
jgi:predicted nucleic acid-binding protein